MVSRRIDRLPGMRDLTGRTFELFTQTMGKLQAYFKAGGYAPIDTPLLEEAELFIRKSGGELASQLYTFVDPGGRRVTLRPEFTSSVIRHYIQERGSLTLPFRCQYAGPVFRYSGGGDGGVHQFTQVGAELIGATGVVADAEMIYVAWEGVERIGLEGHRLRIGHLGVLHHLLGTYGLTEAAKLFIISRVHALKSGDMSVLQLKERAASLGILGGNDEASDAALLKPLDDEEARELLRGVFVGSMPAAIGRRTTDEIVDRLLRKLRDADDPAKFEDAVSRVSQLAKLEGSPKAVVEAGRRIMSEPGVESFDDLEALVDDLGGRGIGDDRMTLDLGLARGISYYTGVIFELTHTAGAREVSLGGGGRYDGLVRALGGDEDVPTLGFAYNMDRVVKAMGPAGSQS